MKRILLFALVMFVSSARAQVYTSLFPETNVKGVPGDIFNITFTLTNPSSTPVYVFINRYQKVIPPFWNSCFCYIQCHEGKQDTITAYIQPFTSEYVSVQFKTDSVNPGYATSYFKMFQIGFPTALTNFTFTADTRSVNGVGLAAATIENKDLTLFPNPVSEILTIRSANEKIQTIKLYDVSGKLLMEAAAMEQLDISRLEKGIYQIHIQTDAKGYHTKIIKN
ncbi:MAG: T9SS type A sorting domain-containing protein [bacterium]|nr:T9SS type A sorting domain-containing protein [bacterium]